jgi:hypothetical protein
VVSLLRIVAYNLLEMLHAVHLRSEAARKTALQQLRDWADAMAGLFGRANRQGIAMNDVG